MTERTIRLNVITHHIGSTWQTGRGDQEAVCGVVLVTACRGTAGTRSLIRGVGGRIVHGDDAIAMVTGFACVVVPVVSAAGEGVIGGADGVAIAAGIAQAARGAMTRAPAFVTRLVVDDTGVPGVPEVTMAVITLVTSNAGITARVTIPVIGPETAVAMTCAQSTLRQTARRRCIDIVDTVGTGNEVNRSITCRIDSGIEVTVTVRRGRSRRMAGLAITAGGVARTVIETAIVIIIGNGQGTTVQTRSWVDVGIGRIGVTVDTIITCVEIIPVRLTRRMATEAVVGAGGTGVAIEAVAGSSGVITEINIGFSGLCISHIGNIGCIVDTTVRCADMRQRARCLRIAGLVTIGTGLTGSYRVSIVLIVGRGIAMTGVTAEAVGITPGTVAG